MASSLDVAVVGAGAAGLMAAIQAGRRAKSLGLRRRIVALDGATRLGAKILVAGGGRCNVTHHVVGPEVYAGASRRALRKVLLQFDVPATVAFFRDLGVELKQEETGKLFPVTDEARTVLDGLLHAAREAGVELWHPWRVEGIERGEDGFLLTRGATPHGRSAIAIAAARQANATAPNRSASVLPGQKFRSEGPILAQRVILATGGKSLPKSGSDGHGHELARALGHTTTPRLLPALVPLVLDAGHFLRGLSGVTLPAGIELRSSSGKRLERFENSTLCTHFGLSGPAVMDMSRYYLTARIEDPGAFLVMDFLPGRTREEVDRELRGLGSVSVLRHLWEDLPERVIRGLCAEAGVEPGITGAELSRENRRALVTALHEMPLPVVGDRGFNHAEVTAGGVPLSELRLETLESRVTPGLHLCGEICDVDGRIGGFNFQWAWASGFVAGRGSVRA